MAEDNMPAERASDTYEAEKQRLIQELGEAGAYTELSKNPEYADRLRSDPRFKAVHAVGVLDRIKSLGRKAAGAVKNTAKDALADAGAAVFGFTDMSNPGLKAKYDGAASAMGFSLRPADVSTPEKFSAVCGQFTAALNEASLLNKAGAGPSGSGKYYDNVRSLRENNVQAYGNIINLALSIRSYRGQRPSGTEDAYRTAGYFARDFYSVAYNSQLGGDVYAGSQPAEQYKKIAADYNGLIGQTPAALDGNALGGYIEKVARLMSDIMRAGEAVNGMLGNGSGGKPREWAEGYAVMLRGLWGKLAAAGIAEKPLISEKFLDTYADACGNLISRSDIAFVASLRKSYRLEARNIRSGQLIPEAGRPAETAGTESAGQEASRD